MASDIYHHKFILAQKPNATILVESQPLETIILDFETTDSPTKALKRVRVGDTVYYVGADAGNTLNYMGEWVSDNEYYINDLVDWEGAKYVCIQDINGGLVTPSVDTENWLLLQEADLVSSVEITGVPLTATNGTFTDEQINYLLANDKCSIMFNSERYIQLDIGHEEGTLGFFHADYENNVVVLKFIEVTISTNAWVLHALENPFEADTQLIIAHQSNAEVISSETAMRLQAVDGISFGKNDSTTLMTLDETNGLQLFNVKIEVNGKEPVYQTGGNLMTVDQGYEAVVTGIRGYKHTDTAGCAFYVALPSSLSQGVAFGTVPVAPILSHVFLGYTNDGSAVRFLIDGSGRVRCLDNATSYAYISANTCYMHNN